MPYQAVSDIWRMSINPANWKTEKSNATIGLWWAAWILSYIVNFMAYRLASIAIDIDMLRAATGLSILTNITDIAAYSLTIAIINTIQAQQDKLVESQS